MPKSKKKDRNYFVWFIGFVSLVLVLYLLFNNNGLIAYFQLKNEINKLNAEIERTETEITGLQKSIDSLRHGNYTIEKIAREKYFMLKPNEQVFSIAKDSIN